MARSIQQKASDDAHRIADEIINQRGFTPKAMGAMKYELSKALIQLEECKQKCEELQKKAEWADEFNDFLLRIKERYTEPFPLLESEINKTTEIYNNDIYNGQL